jgi:Novel toxin 15
MPVPLAVPVVIGGGRVVYMGYKAWKAWRQLQKLKKLKELKDKADKLKKAQQAARARAKPKPKRKVCAACKKQIKCFKKPKGMSDKEFDRQLKEQQDAINKTSADEILKRRAAIRKAGGTDGVRDKAAQQAARTAYAKKRTAELIRQGKTPAQAAKDVKTELASLAATHRLDIIAGGNPSDISGMGDTRVNSSLGSQWKGARSQELEDIAKQMKKEGLGKEKIDVKLKKC